MTPGKPRFERLKNKVREVHAYMDDNATGWRSSEPETTPEPEAQILPEPVVEIVSPDAEHFYREIQRYRGFTRSRPDMSDSLDSMRVVIDGARALKSGVPVAGLLGSITAPWQPDTRAQLQNYVLTDRDSQPANDRESFDYAGFAPRPSRFAHSVSEYVARLVDANVPVWLHGPAGTGKSTAAKHAAQKLAEKLGRTDLFYYEVNLAGAMVSAIKGKDRLNEFIISEFSKAYEFGGVICLEEFDAAHPTVATAVNNAIAGDEFHNDADGRTIKRHPDFRIVATANTLGTGATKEFGSRQKLDGATIDRFRMGRVFVGLDMELERSIFDSIMGVS